MWVDRWAGFRDGAPTPWLGSASMCLSHKGITGYLLTLSPHDGARIRHSPGHTGRFGAQLPTALHAPSLVHPGECLGFSESMPQGHVGPSGLVCPSHKQGRGENRESGHCHSLWLHGAEKGFLGTLAI